MAPWTLLSGRYSLSVANLNGRTKCDPCPYFHAPFTGTKPQSNRRQCDPLLLSYKTCLDTKPVLYQDRFCGLTHVHVSWGLQYSDAVTVIKEANDDVIQWKHFLRYWPFVKEIYRWPVDSPHKGQWGGSLLFSLNRAWTNGSANNRDAGDLRRHLSHCDVNVMHHGQHVRLVITNIKQHI